MNDDARLDKLIAHWIKFTNLAKNLLNTTDDKFEELFIKLYNMDKRSLVLFIRKHKDKISNGQIEFVKKYYKSKDWNIIL